MKQVSLRVVKSADRTLDLLEALAGAAGPQGFAELSRDLGIPKSSLFHLLGTLIERGYVCRDPDNRYRLGPRIAALARAVARPAELADLVAPALRALCAALNETCSFNVERGDEVEVLATCSGNHSLSYTMRQGELAPLYAVSSGKVFLADRAPAELDAYLARVAFDRFTEATIQSPARLLRDIERTRAEGFGFVDEEFTPGIVGLAVPVRAGRRLVGAINVALPRARFDDRAASRIRQGLRSAAAQAEAALAEAAPAGLLPGRPPAREARPGA